MEVKVAGTKGDGSGPETCALEVVLAEGRRIEVRRNFDQLVDFSATTPLPDANSFALCHPDTASKTRPLD
jgi:hypothetical protein